VVDSLDFSPQVLQQRLQKACSEAEVALPEVPVGGRPLPVVDPGVVLLSCPRRPLALALENQQSPSTTWSAVLPIRPGSAALTSAWTPVARVS